MSVRPVVKNVWDTYEKWCAAQSHLRLYQDTMKEVDNRLKGMIEQQKALFYQLTTFSEEKAPLPGADQDEKSKHGEPEGPGTPAP